ncbi:uncharacterized protein LOC128964638 [Oppia nitens]|uniref:uncharacterized protein LOC128964638 n=1 Tax=Oppia nitens TaxID=1686743 RepID=UPI0023DB2ADD|nr:uncharacterized protein LOC128964638 [Oppia nitens]
MMNMCYASKFIQMQAFIYRTIVKCHQILITSHITCPFHQMSKFDVLRHSQHNQQLVLLLTLLIVFFSSINISMASPIRSDSQSVNSPPQQSSSLTSHKLSLSLSPKWVKPCRLPTHPINPDKDFAGAPPVPVKELLRNVMSRAKVARNHGQQVKEIFLNKTFPDSEFEEGVKTYRQEWLPEIPVTSEQVFQQMTLDESFIKAYQFVQYFAIGLEQVMLDEVIKNNVVNEFKDNLFQLLCEIQLGMYIKNIQPNTDILRNVMSHQYRDVNEVSLRNLRDYLLLRDYISATNFIAQLFAHLRDHYEDDLNTD